MSPPIESKLDSLVKKYRRAFQEKLRGISDSGVFGLPPEETLLMKLFALEPNIYLMNRQYFNRELGSLFEKMVKALLKTTNSKRYGNAVVVGKTQLCDCTFGQDAIEVKYRYYSGDAKTVRLYRNAAPKLISMGLKPVMLIFSTDNLRSAIKSFIKHGWQVKEGDDMAKYIKQLTGFDIKRYLETKLSL